MAYSHKMESVVSFFAETTAGQGPADWSANGTRIDHTAADATGWDQDWQVDPRLENRWSAVGQRQLVAGLHQGTATVSVLLTGNGDAAPADGNTPSATALGTLLSHCLGGARRIPSKDLTGGTTTTLEVAAATGWTEGDFVGVQDKTSPNSYNSGKLHIRRITGISGTTITLDEALPFTAASGDLAVGTEMSYVDPDVLEDSTGASGRTLSWYFSNGGSEEVKVGYGCAANLSFADLGRSAQPKIGLSIMCGSWETSPDVAKDVAASSAGIATNVIGRDTKVWLVDFGSTTATERPVASIDIAPGIERSKIETVTEAGEHLEGMAGYSVGGQQTLVTMDIAGYDDQWETDLQAGTWKVCRYQFNGAPGTAWAIHWSRAQIRQTPVRVETTDVSGNKVVLLACEDEDNADSTVAELWKSKITIVRC